MNTNSYLLSPENRRLLEQHKPLVEKIARRLVRSLSANVECDDLIQDGMMGLIDAILRHSKNTTSAQFECFVAQRAKGAMLDGLRASDPASRQVRHNMRQVEKIITQLGHQMGHAPTEGEVAHALEMTLTDYQRLLQNAHDYTLISIDDLGGDDDPDAYLAQCADSQCDPLMALERASLRKALTGAVNMLPRQDQLLLELYYVHGMKMHEVGKILEVSESRVSQIHTQSIAQLRASFASQDNAPELLKPRKNVRAAG